MGNIGLCRELVYKLMGKEGRRFKFRITESNVMQQIIIIQIIVTPQILILSYQSNILFILNYQNCFTLSSSGHMIVFISLLHINV